MLLVIIAISRGGFGPVVRSAGVEGGDPLFVDEFANPLAVHPENFGFVKTGARSLDTIDGEGLDELVFGIDFFFGAIVPAETGEIIK